MAQLFIYRNVWVRQGSDCREKEPAQRDWSTRGPQRVHRVSTRGPPGSTRGAVQKDRAASSELPYTLSKSTDTKNKGGMREFSKSVS